jgi:virulence factor Mce-like protein
MRTTRNTAWALWTSPVLIGTVTVAILGLAVYLSYIAENGLPFLRTYQVNVQVANADELNKNADVRIGGARVGQILTVSPEPPTAAYPHPYAQLRLQLQSSLEPLPTDTHYRIRLASVLGGKYLELLPGPAAGRGVPDGGTLTVSANPGLSHELPFVDLDTALGVFGPKISGPLRRAIGDFAVAVAGRGGQLNAALHSVARLLPPLQSVLGVLADPGNRFGQLISGAADTAAALASVAPTTTALLSDSATTFGALDRPSLGNALDQLPGTESLGTTVLTASQPVLAETAQLAVALRPAAGLLPTGAQRLDAIIRAATPVFGPVPQLASELEASLSATQALARDPASKQVFIQLGGNDLATFGASAFQGLGAILRAAAPAQLACNTAVLWLRNFASGLTEGDSAGSWLRSMPVFDGINQGTQAGSPAPDLHINYYPIENSSQCQAGNEVYSGQQQIGNVPKTTTVVDNTAPPPGVLERGRKAGLVP